MNWKSTLLVVLLAAGSGVWLWKGDTWAPNVGRRAAPADPPALAALEADFTPAAVTRIELIPPTGEAFAFEAVAEPGAGGAPQKAWRQPGNWPVRAAEVSELVGAITHLRTRFRPVPLPDGADLAAYGLADAQKPLTVKVTANGREYVLRCGQPKPAAGETEFTRPAYARVNDAGEVLKLDLA